MAARTRTITSFERVLDAVTLESMMARLGLWEPMRLAQTSKSFLHRVCSSVQQLHMSYGTPRELRANHVVALIRRCAGLRWVYLSGKVASDEVVSALVAYSSSLWQVEIQGQCMSFWDEPDVYISDVAVAALVRVHTTLVKLHLNDQKRLTDVALQSMAQHLPALEDVGIDGCSMISDSGVIVLVTSCTKLRRIDLANCEVGDASVFAIANNCPDLEELSLFRYKDGTVGDESIIALVQGCPKLRELDLSASLITDLAVGALVAGVCPLDKRLDISNCENISSAGIAALVPKWRNIPNLSLELNYTNITEASLLDFAVRLPNLKSINCCGYTHCITDASLNALARGCPVLTHLEFGDDYRSDITRGAVDALSISHPHLKLSAL